ncbi:unnamed protein product, partial [Heterotrigona itama]
MKPSKNLKRRVTERETKIITTKRKSSSLTNSRPATYITTDISADQSKIKPPPIYIHGKIKNYQKLLEALEQKYNNRFHTKYTSEKLIVIFQNITDFNEFNTHTQSAPRKFYRNARDSTSSRKCTKTLEVPSKKLQRQPPNYSKCPALLAFLAKRDAHKNQIQPNNNTSHPQAFPTSKPPYYTTITSQATYANITAKQAPENNESTIKETLAEIKSSDLDLFLRIIELI